MSTQAKLWLLASLYFSQGLPYGFFTQALPVMLRMQGVDLALIGLTSVLYLPWALKFLWAPLVDRYGSPGIGRRRSWLLPLQGLTVALLAGLAFLDPAGGLRTLAVAIFLASLLAATQDVATDGLALDLLHPGERGAGNAVQLAGYRAGMIVGGGILLALMGIMGWRTTYLAMAGLLALASLPALLFREPPAVPSRVAPDLRAIVRGLPRAGLGAWLLLLVIYKSGEAFATGMVRPYLVDAGLTMTEIGLLLGVVASVASLAGALLGGLAVNGLGRRRALVIFGLLQALAVFGFQLAALGAQERAVLYSICVIEQFASTAASAVLFTVMMDACRPHAAATDYTLQACLVVLATGAFAAVSGYSAKYLGYPLHFGLGAVGCLGAVVYVWTMYRETVWDERRQEDELVGPIDDAVVR